MRLPDMRKRQHILATAARMFASQPFHKVRLDDVAAAAQVGKGTLYIYFDSKEDIYFSLIYEGFAALVDQLKAQLAEQKLSAWPRLERVVRELVAFSYQHPQLAELIRTAPAAKAFPQWRQRHQELVELIEAVLRDGVRAGELCDANPHLTARFIPGLVRSTFIYGVRGVSQDTLQSHILHLLKQGIAAKTKTKKKTKKGTR